MKHKKIDICPRCGSGLEYGLLGDTANMRWHEIKEGRTIASKLLHAFGGDIIVDIHDEGFRKTDAEICRQCGLVLFTAKKIYQKSNCRENANEVSSPNSDTVTKELE